MNSQLTDTLPVPVWLASILEYARGGVGCLCLRVMCVVQIPRGYRQMLLSTDYLSGDARKWCT